MRKCSKCDLTYDDSSRICRACGSILEEVIDDAWEILPASVDDDVVSPPSDKSHPDPIDLDQLAPATTGKDRSKRPDWICPACSERVPAEFDVCWNCHADNSGRVAAHEPPADECHMKNCPVCGSQKIIPNVKMADTGQYSAGTLAVVICGNPEAIFFKERLRGEVRAEICGDCGHVQLRVENPTELYERYLRSQE
jgi:hypothetical protein